MTLGNLFKTTLNNALNNSIPSVVSLSNHERNQQVTVHPEPVDRIDQRFPNNTALSQAAHILDYASDFESLWKNDPDGLPEILAQAKGKPLIIVWDGSVNSTDGDRERNDNLLAPHLTPLDWALAFSIRVLGDNNAAANNAKLSIHIIDLTGRAHDEWAVGMRFQLLAEMPWVTLHAPLLVDDTIDHDGYRQGYRPIGGDNGLLLQSSDGTGTSQDWTLPAESKTLVDGMGRHNGLCKLAKQWAAVLTQSDDHHDLNNAIGAYVLDGMMNPDGNAGAAGGKFLPAMLQRLSWCGLAGGQKQIDYPAPVIPVASPIRVLAIDDQLGNSWDRVLLKLVGANSPAEPGEVLNDATFTCIGKSADNALTVFGTLSAAPLIERLEQATFDQRDYLFNYETSVKGATIPEVIVLDLRLASSSSASEQKQQREHILSMVNIAQQKIVNCVSLAWQGISDKELGDIKKWCAHEGINEKPPHLAGEAALTLLPRLLALATPLTPIILFSSTGRADIKAKLQPYRNILVEFEKPRCFSEPETILARLNVFLEQFSVSLAFGNVRRALIWLTEVSATVRERKHPAQLEKRISDSIGRVEIFIDESGDPRQNENSVMGAFCLFHKDEPSARDLNTTLIETAAAAQLKHNGGNTSAIAPVWMRSLSNATVRVLKKYSAINNKKGQRISRIQNEMQRHLAPHLKDYTLTKGLRSYVGKPAQHHGDANPQVDLTRVDAHWDRMARLHVESLVFGVFPWIFADKENPLHVAVYFDQRTVPVDTLSHGNDISKNFGLRFIPNNKKQGQEAPAGRIKVIDVNSVYPMIREADLRWAESTSAQRIQVLFKAGRAVALDTSGLMDSLDLSWCPRMIHWLADWIASVERNDGTPASETAFSSTMPNALRLPYNDDSEKMLQAAWHVAHLRYASGLSLVLGISHFQDDRTCKNDQIEPFFAATIALGITQACGNDLHEAAAHPKRATPRRAVAQFRQDPPATSSENSTAMAGHDIGGSTDAAPTYWHVFCEDPFEVLRVNATVKCVDDRSWCLMENQEGQPVAVVFVDYKTPPEPIQSAPMVGRFMKAKSDGFHTVELTRNDEQGIDGGDYMVLEFDSWIGVTEGDVARSEPALKLGEVVEGPLPAENPELTTITIKVLLPREVHFDNFHGRAIQTTDGQFLLLRHTPVPRNINVGDTVEVVRTGKHRMHAGRICGIVDFTD